MKRKITLCLTLLMFFASLEVIQAQGMLFGYSTLFGFNTRASVLINNHSGNFVFRTTPQETIFGPSSLFVFNTIINNSEIISHSEPFIFNTLPRQSIFGYSGTFTFNTIIEQNEIIGYSDVFLFNTNPKLNITGHSGLFAFNTIIEQSEIIGFSGEFTFNTIPKEIIVAHSETFTFDTRPDEFQVYADINPVNSGVIEGAGVYSVGTIVTLTATANPFFEFENWTNDQGAIVSNNAVYEFIMPSFDVSLTANFTSLSFSVNVGIFPDDAGAVTGAGVYYAGELVTLEAFPNEGFYFHNWTDQDGNVISGDIYYTFIMPAENVELIANFEYILYTVWLSSDPEDGGIVDGGGNYYMGDQVNIEAIANTGYEFESWKDSNNNTISFDVNYSFIMPAEDVELIAGFNALDYLVTVLIEPENTGSVSGAGVYSFNNEVTLVATPNPWYEFIKWTDPEGNILSEAATYIFNMPADDLTIIAYFDLIEGIENVKQKALSIYPNPSSSVFYIESNETIQKIRLIDNAGRILYTRSVNAQSEILQIGHFSEGMYLIQAIMDEYIITKRVAIVK